MSVDTLSALNRVVLVGVDTGQDGFDASLSELTLLAKSAGLNVCGHIACRRKVPDAALYVGSGKVEEIRALVVSTQAHEVIFDQALSPIQQRNLERSLEIPVYDRTMLILEIFARRAQSSEGKLQVELARLQYLSTRLVRRWTHLERQRGGIAGRGGPGETQMELDRRMIAHAVRRTQMRLRTVMQQHRTRRRLRERRSVYNVALVGYTNAGKTTLFNALTKAHAYAANQLFATLDTTTRQLYLQEANASLSLSDTVGFIRDLPHTLIQAFAATLQEAMHADLVLHVVDVCSPVMKQQQEQVQLVLEDIEACDIPQILVFNKTDALPPERKPLKTQDVLEHIPGKWIPCVYVSALDGQGMDTLRALLALRLKAHSDKTVLESDA